MIFSRISGLRISARFSRIRAIGSEPSTAAIVRSCLDDESIERSGLHATGGQWNSLLVLGISCCGKQCPRRIGMRLQGEVDSEMFVWRGNFWVVRHHGGVPVFGHGGTPTSRYPSPSENADFWRGLESYFPASGQSQYACNSEPETYSPLKASLDVSRSEEYPQVFIRAWQMCRGSPTRHSQCAHGVTRSTR
jgi:hypothetical protein